MDHPEEPSQDDVHALREEVARLREQLDAAERTIADLRAAPRDGEHELSRALFERALDMMLIADDEGRYVDANPSACATLGYSLETLRTMTVADMTGLEPAAFEVQWREFKRVGTIRGEVTVRRSDGEPILLEFCSTAHIIPGRHLSVKRDVTALRQAEQAQREVEVRMGALINSVPVIVFATDRGGHVTLSEGAALAGLGRQPGETVGFDLRDYSEIVVDTGHARVPFLEAYQRVLAGESLAGVGTLRGRSYHAHLVPLRDAAGHVDGMLGIVLDITERLDAERAQREGERLLRALFESALDMMIVADDEGRFIDANPSACAALGYSLETLRTMTVADLGDLDPAVIEAWQEFKRLGTQRGEFIARHADGRPLVLEFSATAHIMPGRHLSVLRDTTALHDATQAQRATEYRLRGLLESDLVGVVKLERDGRVSWANQLVHDRLGLCPEALAAGTVHWRHLSPPEQHPRVEAALVQLRDTGRMVPVEKDCLAVDGRRIPMLMSGAGFEPTSARSTLILVDLTERRDAEAALARTSDILDGLVAASPAAIFALDAEGRVELWNPAAEWLLGWPADEVLGKPLPVPMRYRDTRRNGSPAHDAYASDVVTCTLADGSHIEMLLSTAPRTDADGQLVGTTAILFDISEQRQLEARLAEGQKMEAIGRLAGGIAHDLNNVLAAIQGFAELLADSLEPGDVRHEDVDEILNGSERAAALTRQLLAFARRQVLEPTTLEPDGVVRGLEPMLRRVLPADIDLQIDTCAPGWCIHVDRIQLEQVILNLVLNARDAMPDGGTLNLESAVVWREPSVESQGPSCALVVRDTGHGMDAEVLAHIFEPFFTTRELGEGTGLGLATVHGIVSQSGGLLEVDSAPGQGTTFRVYFPASRAEDGDASDCTAPLSRAFSGPEGALVACHVLLVEDEDAVRRLTARLLRAQGHVVHETSGVAEARRLGLDPAQRIDLLLSDVVLRDGDGVTLARELLQARPELPVLLMSGYPGGRKDAATTPLDPSIPFIHKPFTVGELTIAIADVVRGTWSVGRGSCT